MHATEVPWIHEISDEFWDRLFIQRNGDGSWSLRVTHHGADMHWKYVLESGQWRQVDENSVFMSPVAPMAPTIRALSEAYSAYQKYIVSLILEDQDKVTAAKQDPRP